MIYKGKFYLIECKSSIQTSFSFSNVTEHQLDSLLMAHRSGGYGYLIIKADNRRRQTSDRVFAIEIDDFNKLKWTFSHSGRQSIKWDELAQYSKELNEIKTKIWGLNRLWERRTLSGTI